MSQGLMTLIGGLAGRGVATGGTKTTLIDTDKVFEADLFNDTIIKLGPMSDLKTYYRKVTDTANSTLTFATLPGTPATCAWTVVAGHVITTVCVADGGNDYTIESALNAEASQDLAVALVGDVITVTLATGVGGLSDDAKNTATLVAAAIDGLAEFTSSVTTGDGSGVVPETTAAVAFSGGVDEVKPVAGTRYVITKKQNSDVSLSGSYPAQATPFVSTADSGANAAQTITVAAVAGKSHYITAIEVAISGAAAVSTITAILKEDAAGTPASKWKEIIGIASPIGTRVGIAFPIPIKLTTAKTADLVIDAGGAAVITTGNISGYTL